MAIMASASLDSTIPRLLTKNHLCAEAEDSIMLEMQLPFWTDPEDVTVKMTPHTIDIHVGQSIHVVRSCWSHR